MAQSRRKRKRAKARGDRSKTHAKWGVGELRADWKCISVEDAAHIRQAVRENWPTENGEAIIAAITSAIDPVGQPRGVIRLAHVMCTIDRHSLLAAKNLSSGT